MDGARVKIPDSCACGAVCTDADVKRHLWDWNKSGDQCSFCGKLIRVSQLEMRHYHNLGPKDWSPLRKHPHARSLDTASHPSRDWIWGLHRQVGHQIDEGWRICGENLYAKHSIHYTHLKALFQVFGIWDEKNTCLSWDDTVIYAGALGLQAVDVIYRGPFDEKKIQDLAPQTWNGDPCEGYVCRVARAFAFKEFRSVVGKVVRRNHVHTHGHWMRQAIVPNLTLDFKEMKKPYA